MAPPRDARSRGRHPARTCREMALSSRPDLMASREGRGEGRGQRREEGGDPGGLRGKGGRGRGNVPAQGTGGKELPSVGGRGRRK